MMAVDANSPACQTTCSGAHDRTCGDLHGILSCAELEADPFHCACSERDFVSFAVMSICISSFFNSPMVMVAE